MQLMPHEILFSRATHQARTPDEIAEKIGSFPDKYKEPMVTVIRDCCNLDSRGEVFVSCTARILTSFGMTRNGPFKGVEIRHDGSVSRRELLFECWQLVGGELMAIRDEIPGSGSARDRYLLELSESARTELVARIWLLTKYLLPKTMGQTSYGLVGASKILFAVLPEIVLLSFTRVFDPPVTTVIDPPGAGRLVSSSGHCVNSSSCAVTAAHGSSCLR